MPAETPNTAMARLLRCTERMLECAEAGDWLAIELLEKERNQEMATCFNSRMENDDSSLMSDSIAALLVLNDKLVTRVAAARGRILGEVQELQQGRAASAAYSQVQTSN
ncbi:MAG: flagellar protein FliT [Halieaceae bacterium]